MEGLYFLTAIIAVGVVILWSKANDQVPMDGKTSGLFAMLDRAHKGPTSPASRTMGGRRRGSSPKRR